MGGLRRFLLALLAIWLVGPLSGQAAVNYSDSAHGNLADRDGIPSTYAQGNCAHCHEQHASVGGSEPVPDNGGPSSFLLLAEGFSGKQQNTYGQADNVCFYCHTSSASLQSLGITNNDYSATFGGATVTTSGILEAFNQTSYHNLYDIGRCMTGSNGAITFTAFPAGTNPCLACHNAHLAKENNSAPGDPTLTAISRPAAHNSLWGDDSPTERMASASYQPPMYFNTYSTLVLEPDGGGTNQAEKTPDYNTFCIDCHNATTSITSTSLGRPLNTFDWTGTTASPDQHGAGIATNRNNFNEAKPPYVEASLGSYSLACTDCHEPHGSPNAFLIRSYVNGNVDKTSFDAYPAGPVTAPETDWLRLCARCHPTYLKTPHHDIRFAEDPPGTPLYTCASCHATPNPPYGGDFTIDCTNCHRHGLNF